MKRRKIRRLRQPSTIEKEPAALKPLHAIFIVIVSVAFIAIPYFAATNLYSDWKPSLLIGVFLLAIESVVVFALWYRR